MRMHLRAATIDDLCLLEYRDTKQHNIDPNPNDDWNWSIELTRNPAWRKQLVSVLDDRPIRSRRIKWAMLK